MTEIFTEPWQIIAAALLVLIGGAFVGAGVRSGPGRWRAEPGAARAFVYLHTFRRVVVGLAAIAAAAGLVLHVHWLLAASITIGIGEWLESSYYLAVLRSGRYWRAGNDLATTSRA